MTPLIPPPPEAAIIELYEELIRYVRQRQRQGLPDFGRPLRDVCAPTAQTTIPARPRR